jgi:hypothetical protein
LKEEYHMVEEHVDCEIMPSVEPIHSQSITHALKEEELPCRESLFENASHSRESFHSLNSSTYFYLYDLFNGLTLQEATHCSIQINSMGSTHFEVLEGGDVHLEDREDKALHELITTKPYQHFSWDEENYVANVYQRMSSSFSSSFFINRESFCPSSPLFDIIDTSRSHHCFEYISHTMVGPSPCISFDLTSLSQVDGCLKYESRESYLGNEALWF